MLGGRRPRGAAKGKLCDVAVGLQNSQCFKSPFQRHPMEIITDVNTNWASEILSAVSLVAGKECCRLSSSGPALLGSVGRHLEMLGKVVEHDLA